MGLLGRRQGTRTRHGGGRRGGGDGRLPGGGGGHVGGDGQLPGGDGRRNREGGRPTALLVAVLVGALVSGASATISAADAGPTTISAPDSGPTTISAAEAGPPGTEPAEAPAGPQRPARPAPGGAAPEWVWPVAGAAGAARPVVLRGWEPPPAPWAAGHRGVDLAARRGQPVRAAAAGRVVFAGPVAGRGVISIELDGTGRPPLRITYEPVRPTVRKGDRVAAGQVVGALAADPGAPHCRNGTGGSAGTGASSGPPGCLHWGLRRGDRYLDPLSLLPPSMLRRGPSRLLPVFGIPEPPGNQS